VDCKKLLSGAYGNHAIFAKPVCKDSVFRWCTYYRTLRTGYNMYPQPPPFTKLPVFTNAKRKNRLLLSELFWKSSLTSHHASEWFNGKRHYLGVIRSMKAIYLIDVLWFRNDKTCTRHSQHNFALFESMVWNRSFVHILWNLNPLHYQ